MILVGAVGFGWLMLGEQINMVQWNGIAIVMAVILLSQIGRTA